MNFKTISSLFVAISVTSAFVTPAPQGYSAPFIYEQLSFTFYGGPVQYNLNFQADGNFYPTNNALSVSQIDTNGFDALGLCNFNQEFYGPLPGGSKNSNGPLDVGPPQPIIGVACFPLGYDGACLPEYCELTFPIIMFSESINAFSISYRPTNAFSFSNVRIFGSGRGIGRVLLRLLCG